ncbi:MAG TPA: hypothetical protein VKP14_06190 [Gaiellaceae bacterium]|nr:hypothetical protein [Gaiellaceae bacterium]
MTAGTGFALGLVVGALAMLASLYIVAAGAGAGDRLLGAFFDRGWPAPRPRAALYVLEGIFLVAIAGSLIAIILEVAS